MVPQDIDSQPALNCFPISKSFAQNFTFIMNETDLSEGSGLERHAKALAFTLCEPLLGRQTHTEETGLWFFCLDMKG